MNAEELLALIAEHRTQIRDRLTTGEFRQLLEALQEMSGTGDYQGPQCLALYRAKQALLPLVSDSPTQMVEDEVSMTAAVSSRIPEQAQALFGQLVALEKDDDATQRIIAAAHRRLLSAPSRGAADLDPRTAIDPVAAGLIRLNDPERGPRYPDFQFDPAGGGPLAVVRRVNRLLWADRDPWAAADWWLGGNRWLEGVPADLIGRIPDRLLTAAAQAFVEVD
ncbi:hypothetical protein [Streptomyces sp. URMC 129]|uniref:hypothetical protein n=1 Tax=Streptomyces sp. URMC 129 TaxID=3423407 RepID=UPI003F1ADD68